MVFDAFSDVLSLISVILVLIAVVVFALVYGKAKNTELTLERLRGDRDDLEKRVDRLEEEKSALAVDNEKLHKEVSVLKELVTSREAVNQLAKIIERHDELVEQRYHEYSQNLNKVLEALNSLAQSVSKMQDHIHTPDGRIIHG